MPRSIWTGAISFGLVNVPVRLFPAVHEHKLHFHLVHEKDSSPIGYQKVCKAEDKPVDDDEIVKAFELSKGEYVFMDDEDFEQARAGSGHREIDIVDFVPADQIDPIFFAQTYYLGPGDGAERVYALLTKALEDSELVAVAKFVMRQRQHLGALRVRDGLLTLEQLYFADEINPVKELRPAKHRVAKEELAMARQLIESRTADWKPERYKDTYRDELVAAIEAKRKGEDVHEAADVAEYEQPVDLMDALRASIERSQGAKKAGGRRASNGGKLDGLSKDELLQRARKAGIEGRSSMTKPQLVKALRAA